MNESIPNKLSIVLPVFNEAKNIENVISNISNNIFQWVDQIELIAVNDGSTDETLSILNRMSHQISFLKVISHPSNEGYGGALTSGIKAAQNPWILLIDSDGQFYIESLFPAWEKRGQYDILLGYRRKRNDNFYRIVLGKMGNTLARFFLRFAVKDINCGFKIFKKEFLKPLPLASKGGIINFEILYFLLKMMQSARIYQFPVEHYSRRAGKSTGGMLRIIYRILIEGFNVVFKRIKS